MNKQNLHLDAEGKPIIHQTKFGKKVGCGACGHTDFEIYFIQTSIEDYQAILCKYCGAWFKSDVEELWDNHIKQAGAKMFENFQKDELLNKIQELLDKERSRRK